jgi:hypothetical protein
MTKLVCECTSMIPISGKIPNPLEWKFMPDVQFDDFQGYVNAEEVYSACNSFFCCPNCGRLWIFWNGFEGEPACYVPSAGHES